MTRRERHKAWRDLFWDAPAGGREETRFRVRMGLPVGFPLREGDYVESIGGYRDLGIVDSVQGDRAAVLWMNDGGGDDIDASSGYCDDFDFWVRRAPFQKTAAKLAKKPDLLIKAKEAERQRHETRWLTIEWLDRHRWIKVFRILRAVLKLPLGPVYECVQGRRVLTMTPVEAGELAIRLRASLARYTIHTSKPQKFLRERTPA